MTKAKMQKKGAWESHVMRQKTRFNEIPMVMEHYINDFNEKLEELGWRIACVDMQPGNIMLIKLKEVNGE